MKIRFTYKLSLVFIIFYIIPGISCAEKENQNVNNEQYANALLLEVAQLFQEREYNEIESKLKECEYFLPSLKSNSLIVSDYYRFKGKLYTINRDFEDSHKLLRKAILIRENNTSENDSILSYMYNNQGVNLLQLGGFSEAVKCFERSINIKQKYFEENDPVFLSSYNNLGILYKKISGYENELNAYSKAEKIYEKNIDKYDNYRYGKLLNNKANLLNNLARLEEAMVYYKKAFNIVKEDSDPNLYSLLYVNIGSLYLKNNEYEKALDYFEKCIAYREKNELKPFPINFNNIGRCYSLLGNNLEALKSFNKALMLYSNDYGKDYYKLGLVYKNLGDHFLRNKQYLKSQISLEASIDILIKNFDKNHPGTSGSYMLLGDLYKEKGNFQTALNYYNIPLEFYNEDLLLPIPNKLIYLEIFAKKADALYQNAVLTGSKDELLKAFKSYKKAFLLINEIKAGYLSDNSRLRFLDKENEILSNAIDVVYQLYELSGNMEYLPEAFYISEMNKASVLNNSLNEAEALINGNIPDSLITAENKLKKQINYLENDLLKDNEDIIHGDISSNDKLIKLYKERERLIKQFEKNYPEYYDLKYKPITISIGQLQENLGNNKVMIEYNLTDNYLYSFLITKSKFELVRQEIDSDFFNTLFYIHSFVYYNPEIKFQSDHFRKFAEESHLIYNILIKPFEKDIVDKKITIIPDAELNYIPFEVLLTEYSGNENYRNYASLPYLIHKNAISYNYSVTTLNIIDKSVEYKDNKIAAFAPHYNEGIYINDELATRNKLINLKGTLTEVKHLSRIFKCKSFTGQDATEENFKSAFNNFSIIHLAMHAELDDKNPMFSNLYFTDSENSKEDGKLNTYELFNMRANPKLVVLSACNTGYGKLKKGEGVMSIARGFVYAGCPSLVITLWSLNDESGSILMNDFYTNLSFGQSKDIALQKAKLDYLKSAKPLKLHPYYWAGYVNVGNTKPVIQKTRNKKYLSFIPIIILLLLPIIVFNKKIDI